MTRRSKKKNTNKWLIIDPKDDVPQLCHKAEHYWECHIHLQGCAVHSTPSDTAAAQDIAFPIWQTSSSTYLGYPRTPIWQSMSLDTPAFILSISKNKQTNRAHSIFKGSSNSISIII